MARRVGEIPGRDSTGNGDVMREQIDQVRREREALMKIRAGLRLVLRGWEELWGLPLSFETKREKQS